MELAWDSLSPSVSAPPLLLWRSLSLSLSVSLKINKLEKKKKSLTERNWQSRNVVCMVPALASQIRGVGVEVRDNI